MVSTHLKNISPNGNLPQIGMKIKNVWNHHLGNYYLHILPPPLPPQDSNLITRTYSPHLIGKGLGESLKKTSSLVTFASFLGRYLETCAPDFLNGDLIGRSKRCSLEWWYNGDVNPIVSTLRICTPPKTNGWNPQNRWFVSMFLLFL